MARIIRNAVFILPGLLASLIVVTIQPWVTPVPSQPPASDPARLQAHVRELTETHYPRSPEIQFSLCKNTHSNKI